MIVTSCPYDDMDDNFNPIPAKGMREYEGYEWNFKQIARQMLRVLKPGGVLCWVVNDPTEDGEESIASALQKIYFKRIGFTIHDTIIYEKTGNGSNGSNYQYAQSFEYLFVLSKGKPKTINLLKDRPNKYAGVSTSGERLNKDGSKKDGKLRIINEYGKRTTVWQIANDTDKRFPHPAPMPYALAEACILSWSNPGDIVLDVFSGRGTVAKAAYQTYRNFLAFDISQKYINISKDNLSEALRPLFIETNAEPEEVETQLRLL